MSLAVFGSIGLDDVETPSGSVHGAVGGSAVYFSLAASLYTHVQVAGNVGNDFPPEAWDTLRHRGADLSGLKLFRDRPNFRWRGRYEGDMNEAITLETQLNVLEVEPEVPASYLDARLVFLANMGPDVQAKLRARFPKAMVWADTMNLWIRIQREALEALLPQLDGLVLNDGEARMLTGEHNLIAAGARLQELGPKIVVVKKGEHGAFLFAPDGRFSLPAYPTTRVVDPTGAGDSFAGGLLGSLAASGSHDFPALRRAMVDGTVCASLTVEEFSTRGLEAADPAELARRSAELRAFVDVG
ncbi:MAG: PfkB family carbohydrate kinase [Planctomycetota bacterium]|nr:PfkB family carbohydrate kinase [Planctomycetota bacterium]